MQLEYLIELDQIEYASNRIEHERIKPYTTKARIIHFHGAEHRAHNLAKVRTLQNNLKFEIRKLQAAIDVHKNTIVDGILVRDIRRISTILRRKQLKLFLKQDRLQIHIIRLTRLLAEIDTHDSGTEDN